MAIVRLPGTTVEYVLERDREKDAEEQTVFLLKVLNYDQWKRWIKALRGVRNDDAALEQSRKLLGTAISEVRNLKIMDGTGQLSDFTLEKSGEELTAQCMGHLYPFLRELLDAVESAQTFKVDQAKN